LQNNDLFFRLNGLKRPIRSIETINIVNISELNVTYKPQNLFNGLINRSNTPSTDSFPSQLDLFFNELENGDAFAFTIRNIGAGELNISRNDIIRDTNDKFTTDLNFFTLPPDSAADFVIYYSSIDGNFHINIVFLSNPIKAPV
jgi:hypothetical protein